MGKVDKNGVGHISASAQKIKPEAFRDCTDLTSIVIPNSVTEIGESAFEGCTGLTSIVIPDSVTRIGDSAFMSTGLTYVTFRGTVKDMGDELFIGCPPIGFYVPAGKEGYYKKQHLREDPWFILFIIGNQPEDWNEDEEDEDWDEDEDA